MTDEDKAILLVGAAAVYVRMESWNLLEAQVIKLLRDERERCAQVAENVHMFTGSQTVERVMATRVLPRVAKTIRELK
jgi:hypothetical protein